MIIKGKGGGRKLSALLSYQLGSLNFNVTLDIHINLPVGIVRTAISICSF